MDFLDPRKKRSHRVRLMIGYALMTIAISLGTIILVYGAYGYSINTKTGSIVQNGLLFLDSKPGAANIYLNGNVVHANTPARLVLPAATYTITFKKTGYRDWQRTFDLNEHSVSRFVYPFLLPTTLSPATLKVYSSQPGLISQSLDRHWILVQTSGADPRNLTFDEYDTTNLAQPNSVLTVPAALVTNASLPGSTLTEVEWASDNNHLLLQHNYAGGSEFIIVDRTDPAASININKLFNISPTQIALRNKKIDQLYIYDQTAGSIQVGDVGKASVGAPLLSHVLAFKGSGSNQILYVTDSGVPTGKVVARLWNNGKSYPIYTFDSGNTYLVNVAQFQGHTYFVAGSNASDRINIYKDPLSDIQNPVTAKAIPFMTLLIPGPTKVAFSTNTRFVAVQASQSFGVYDFETQTRYQYNLQTPLGGPLRWMDGHRLIGAANSAVFVMDYDSTNQQSLLPTTLTAGGYFSRDFNQLITTAPITGTDAVSLEFADMRTGSDLPKP